MKDNTAPREVPCREPVHREAKLCELGISKITRNELDKAFLDPSLFDIAEIFTRAPRSPIYCEDATNLTRSERRAISRRCSCFGFAVLEFPGGVTPVGVSVLAGMLGLGIPFIPPYLKGFRPSIFDSHGMKFAGRKDQTIGPVEAHPLHTDGSCMKRVGAVQTALQLCVSEPERGGEVVLFHATAAVKELYEEDAEIALSLFAPYALRRKISGLPPVEGPAFSILNGSIVTRFALDHSADWSEGFKHSYRLQTAVKRLERWAEVGSPYRVETTLQAGQVLLIANGRLCHGRKDYVDSESKRRSFVHALFQKTVSDGRS